MTRWMTSFISMMILARSMAQRVRMASFVHGGGGSTFCNPPYGREIGKWTRKAMKEAKLGKTVVLLVPSRTDTVWWHQIMDFMEARDEIRFIKGRLKFGDAKNSAPFPSAVIVFRNISGQRRGRK